MANERFEIGDLVQLKSGGPVMTVYDANHREVTCKWFAGAKLEQGHFALEMLQSPPQKPDGGKTSKQ